MSPLTALIPAAASAATSLAKSAVHGIAEGFSFAAELAKGKQDTTTAAATQPTTPSLPAELEQAIEQFAEMVRQRLASAGIDLSQPVSLSGDGLGGLEVTGAHEQAETIEALMAQDAQIADAFHQLAARYQAATGGPDPLASSLPWDQSSAGRHVALQIGTETARAELL